MTKRDTQLVQSLARGATYPEASRATGLSVRTICRRMEQPAFRREVEQARRQLLDAAVGQLIDGARIGIDTLQELAAGAESESVRCSSARALAAYVLPLREQTEIEDRLSRLEARFNEQNGNRESYQPAGTNGRRHAS